MATGTMTINYHSYSSKKAADALSVEYRSKGNFYKGIHNKINEAFAYGACFSCTEQAAQLMQDNQYLMEEKSLRLQVAGTHIERFMTEAVRTDVEVAGLFGYHISDPYNGPSDQDMLGLFIKIGDSILKENADQISYIPGVGTILSYLVKGEYDDQTTTETFAKFYADVIGNYDLIVKNSDAYLFFQGDGTVFSSVANAASALYNNWEDYSSGIIGFDRMLVEASTEAVTDIYLDTALTTAACAVLGPAGFVVAPIASWGIDQIFEMASGKGLAENVGEFAGTVYDFAVSATDAVNDILVDGAKAIGNVTGDFFRKAGDVVSDSLYTIERSMASWFSW